MQINDLHFWKTMYIYKDLTELYVIFVYAMALAGTKLLEGVKCFEYNLLLRTCFRFECKTAIASAHARTRITNAYTKCGIENSYLGT